MRLSLSYHVWNPHFTEDSTKKGHYVRCSPLLSSSSTLKLCEAILHTEKKVTT